MNQLRAPIDETEERELIAPESANPSRPFILRPVATALLAIAVFMAGVVAFVGLPIAPLPRVDFPTLQVQANLPGASPETMASAVATPLERRLGRIAGLNEITSVSTLGSTSLTLQFDLARDVDAAARDVQAAINAAGELVGANFDSTVLTQRNAYGYDPAVNRSVIVSAAAITAVEQAVMNGTLTDARLNDAVSQVLAAKGVDPCTLSS